MEVSLGRFLVAPITRNNFIRVAKTPPAVPAANPPDFFTVDPVLLSGFITFCSLAHNYKMVPFPKMSDTIGLPLMLLSKQEANNSGQIRSKCLVPNPADCFLRFVHEELFIAPPFAWGDCQYVMTDELPYQEKKKRFYRCNKVPRKGVQCAAEMYLLFEADSEAVLLYSTDREHNHDFENNYRYGICDETKSEINKLYDLHLKLKSILEHLKKNPL
ncbi:hypothetical protein HF086_002901 [Spodoptera exigua]|uniref:Uncharacterized protein n=1 Tax=Spodoptera exigua TaxID=7107 RepID=A0A922SBS0_SPOEX|nr:hypothetical protein HF086_002901 [Spodoptera exigua]